MAGYAAISATSEAILGLLERAAPGTPFANLSLAQYGADDLQSPMSTGISLYLYRCVVCGELRNAPPRLGPDGRLRRPPVPLDLHYLVIAWGQPLQQQRALAWAARVLADTPILPAGLLNHFGPEADTFRPDETVELVLEPLSRQEMFDVWEVAKVHTQPALAYSARMIEIDSTAPFEDGVPVQTREFAYATGARP